MKQVIYQNREWIQALVDNAMDAIISIDEHQSIVIFNKAAETVFKIKAEDALGHTLDQFIPEKFRESHRERVAAFSETANTTRSLHSPAQVTGLRSDGEEFPIEATISHSVIDEHKLMTVILRDVTHHRNIERQIVHLQKMEALGRLAGGIAHDFNNMLQIVRANADLVMSGGLGRERVQHNLHDILEAVTRGTELVKQLMAFSRERPPKQVEQMDISGVLAEIDKMVPRLIGEQVKLTVNRGINLKAIVGDSYQIFQAIVNLVINAKDAMPNGGGITINAEMILLDEHYVRHHPGAKVGQHVLVSVADTGTGMPPSVKERMFDPFFTTKAEGKGTGLGLSLVVGTMLGCGGHVTAYSEDGMGTVIKLFFPAKDQTITHVLSSGADGTDMDGAILIVEDEMALRSVMCEVIVAHGYSVLEATNGLEAIDIAKRHHDRIRLVISDVVMPTMGGMEMVRQLQKIIPKFSLILMSGYDSLAEDVDTSLNLRWLGKPFAMAEMLKAIKEVTQTKETE